MTPRAFRLHFLLRINLFGLLLLATCHLSAQRQPAPPKVPAEWLTPAERSDYHSTPDYEETMAYLRRMQTAARDQMRLERFGTTGEGRPMFAAIVSRDGVFDPVRLHNAGRPIVMIQNGIHAGEIAGKDASLALLRDILITKEHAALIDRAVLVVIPIYNIDGHEHASPYNRINQSGPELAGWRANAGGLNLNRDYLKAQAPETRALLSLFNRWLPDFFMDNHVSDGADYQYDTTYQTEKGPNVFPAQADWLRSIEPGIDQRVTEAGHIIGPAAVGFVDVAHLERGVPIMPATPRFSNGYMVLQNRPNMLVEMHSLKSFPTRVLGNYWLMVATLETVNRDAARLVAANRAADQATIAAGRTYDPARKLPLRLAASGQTEPFLFRGVKFTRQLSEVSGALWTKYTTELMDVTIPRQTGLKPTLSIAPPLAYIIPAHWTAVIEVLAAHGVEMRRSTHAWSAEVETYRCPQPHWREEPFEGRHPLSFDPVGQAAATAPLPIFSSQSGASSRAGAACEPVRATLFFPPGSVVVRMDQRAGHVAVQWLEPEAPDSALQWGFFDSIFERKEYAEAYSLEPLAREMMARDPKLKQEFEQKIASDPEFAASPGARLDFFYRRSPYWDESIGLYPVGRLHSLAGVPLE